MSGSRISVVIPVRNGARYLSEAVETVLRQRPGPDQILVVDDGSVDASAEIASRFGAPVECLRQPAGGIGKARNAGIAAATGDYIGFLDADDLWTGSSLTTRVAAAVAPPGADLVFGHVRHFLSPELTPEMAARLVCPSGLRPAYVAGGMLARRDAFRRVGAFREDVVSGEFIDWLARAREAGLREMLVEDEVLLRRLHTANHGRLRPEARQDYVRVVRAALHRRAAAQEQPRESGRR